jgi:sRNA-binding protein
MDARKGAGPDHRYDDDGARKHDSTNCQISKPRPDPTQALDREAWKASAVEALAALNERFPACFAPLRQSHRWPLKVGIHADILELAPDLSPAAIGRALSFYTTGRSYLRSMVANRPRIDLNGAAFGIVTPEQAASAAQWLAKRKPRRTATTPSTPKPASPPRLTLAGLKEAAAKRRATAS